MADTSQAVPFTMAPPAGAVLCEDEEFPYSHGTVNGVKCCTKCGATKTPQWREGPFGPKTLCNACGVKRTRKLRAEQEGAKRRKLAASPVAHPKLAHAPAGPKYTRNLQHSQDVSGMDRYGSLEPESEAWAPPVARRPPRRAAEEAAYRTARYARTGEWAECEQEAGLEAVGAATPTSSSDYSLPSSSCPEEVCWPAGSGEPASSDCFAAINLMTMSATNIPALALATAASASLSSLPAPRLASAALDAEQDAASGRHGSTGTHTVRPPQMMAAADLAELASCLPPAKVLELVRLNQDLESAVHEAHAAGAAVAAVAHVLAAKQAAALRAREVAGAATKRLRRFMTELDMQFGIQPKLGSRKPPLSPTKPAMAMLPGSPPALPVPALLAPTAPLSPSPAVVAPCLPDPPPLRASSI